MGSPEQRRNAGLNAGSNPCLRHRQNEWIKNLNQHLLPDGKHADVIEAVAEEAMDSEQHDAVIMTGDKAKKRIEELINKKKQ